MFRPLLAKRFLLISSLFNMIHYIKFFFFRYKNKEINGLEEMNEKLVLERKILDENIKMLECYFETLLKYFHNNGGMADEML